MSQIQNQNEQGMERLLTQKDQKNQPVFLPTDGKTIAFKEQILPFWSQICESVCSEETKEEI